MCFFRIITLYIWLTHYSIVIIFHDVMCNLLLIVNHIFNLFLQGWTSRSDRRRRAGEPERAAAYHRADGDRAELRHVPAKGDQRHRQASHVLRDGSLRHHRHHRQLSGHQDEGTRIHRNAPSSSDFGSWVRQQFCGRRLLYVLMFSD